jgi:hypothetical protein
LFHQELNLVIINSNPEVMLEPAFNFCKFLSAIPNRDYLLLVLIPLFELFCIFYLALFEAILNASPKTLLITSSIIIGTSSFLTDLEVECRPDHARLLPATVRYY